MKKATSHKEVEYGVIDHVRENPDGDAYIVRLEDGQDVPVESHTFGQGVPSKGDYLWIGPDGYCSWNTKGVFERDFTPNDDGGDDATAA